MKNGEVPLVLVVDDDFLGGSEVARMLSANGYEALHVPTGTEALATLDQRDDLDLVLLDVNLGKEEDGPAVAQRILEKRLLPIVFLTGYGDRHSVQRAAVVNHYGYVLKNAGSHVLLEAVHIALSLFHSRKIALDETNRFHLLFTSIRDAIIVVNGDRLIEDCNPAFTDMFGYTREEIAGQTTELLFEHRDDYLATGDALRTMAEVRSFRKTVSYRRRDGSTFVGEKTIQYREDGKGGHDGFIGVIRDVTEQFRAREQIQSLLHEKETLLGEIHHRVKNNMATIESLLTLQASRLDDELQREALEEARRRVSAMRTLYDQLGGVGGFHAVQLGAYLETLLDALEQTMGPLLSHVTMVRDLRSCSKTVDSRVAFPLGMMVNEAITNSFKHGYPGGRTGTVTVRLVVDEQHDGACFLEICDDGIGLPDSPQGGLGMTLMEGLAEQVHGTVTCSRNGSSGTTVRITLP